MISILLVMACGDEDDGFGSGGSSTSGGGADNACNADNADNADNACNACGGDTGESSGGDGVFPDVSATCSGDNVEWTWTLSATLSSGASALWVEVDPNTADYDKWDLSMVDGGGKQWEAEVTELYTATDCDGEKLLEWHAMVGGDDLETTETSYSP